MDPNIQILLGVLATITSIAAAIAAWMSFATSRSALKFQKKLAKHQDSLFLMRSTLSDLRNLKRILDNPLASSDDDYSSLEIIHHKIRTGLNALFEAGMLEKRASSFFEAQSRAEIIDALPIFNTEIEIETKRIEQKINDLFK